MARQVQSEALWRATRWPVLAIVVAALLVGLAVLLDTGSPTARD